MDERLNATLDKRLGESFRSVSDRLDQVYEGLGEMQALASGVGDLKRVLTGVRARGQMGEIQLEALLRQILGPYIGKLDALVLGCTHYPFAAKAISRVLGPEVTLLEGGDGTARETRRRLAAADLLEEGEGEIRIINSSDNPEMIRLSRERLEQER